MRVHALPAASEEPEQSMLARLNLGESDRAALRAAMHPFGNAPFINSWLVAGLYEHAQVPAPVQATPREGDLLAGRPWRYFDDRLFSRNLDDYQDLRSYHQILRDECTVKRCAYAHVHVYSESAQPALAAWINGRRVLAHREGSNLAAVRDAHRADVQLDAGWNRLLLRVGNRGAGLFGFYARLCDANGNRLSGVTCSPHGSAPTLGVVTRAMSDPDTPALPAAFREWTYVRLNPLEWVSRAHIPKLSAMAWASDFQLTAERGRPPYRWALVEGALPPGLDLHPDGRITGIVAAAAELRDHPLVVEVTDADGARAVKPLAMPVRERPNRWLEEAALIGLIHRPEHIPADGFDAMAELMARQGYQLGVPISWGNGRQLYNYASIFEEDSPLGDILTPLKEAFGRHDIRFGMYFGNMDGPQIGEENGTILVFEEAMVRWNPWVFWFDWAVWDGGYALDAIYSMIKTRNPDTLIILNQAQTSRYGLGDWDLLCMEAWGGWGERLWVYWPFNMPYAKAFQMNS